MNGEGHRCPGCDGEITYPRFEGCLYQDALCCICCVDANLYRPNCMSFTIETEYEIIYVNTGRRVPKININSFIPLERRHQRMEMN